MREISVSRDIDAPRDAVWAVLADFPSISTWNTGVKNSFSTSDEVEGVGARRHCDLAPMGTLDETIAEWEPGERLVVSIDSAGKLPMKRGRVTFTLADQGDPTTIDYAYEPGMGPFGRLMGPVIDKQLVTGMAGFLEDLETAAKKRAAV